MKYFFQFKKDPFDVYRIILPEEICLFSDFIEDITTETEAEEYIDDIENVLNGSYEDFEIQLNATSVLIKKDETEIEHFFRNEEPYIQKIETKEFKELLLVWKNKIKESVEN
ncbi:tRNA-Val4 [Metabacillus elymi]|uniref:tRNA-Val4 n=1 Tax=Metabacillus elymi TaxID=2745198 RepID=A0ABX6SCK8_9BACI|nr:tRNA-Val4 [Metabacillus sp. KUDC1714]QNF31101.1 tRNA-Val4 [Metabacillus sp. KUDC1714]